jgi:hypothetical protein
MPTENPTRRRSPEIVIGEHQRARISAETFVFNCGTLRFRSIMHHNATGNRGSRVGCASARMSAAVGRVLVKRPTVRAIIRFADERRYVCKAVFLRASCIQEDAKADRMLPDFNGGVMVLINTTK